MSEFNIIMATNESTVVAEYTPEQKKSDAYQSEAALEDIRAVFCLLVTPHILTFLRFI